MWPSSTRPSSTSISVTSMGAGGRGSEVDARHSDPLPPVRPSRTTGQPSVCPFESEVGRADDAGEPASGSSRCKGNMGSNLRAQRAVALSRSDRARVRHRRGSRIHTGDPPRRRTRSATSRARLIFDRFSVGLRARTGHCRRRQRVERRKWEGVRETKAVNPPVWRTCSARNAEPSSMVDPTCAIGGQGPTPNLSCRLSNNPLLFPNCVSTRVASGSKTMRA